MKLCAKLQMKKLKLQKNNETHKWGCRTKN